MKSPTTGRKKTKIKKPKQAANLAREIWRLIDRCEAQGWPMQDAGCGNQLQGAHIIGVGTAIRICSDVRNGFSLCSTHHRWFHDHPHDFTEFIEGSWAEKYLPTLRRLAVRQLGDPKIDWDDRIDFLKEIRRAIKAGELTIEQAREYEA